eukprot:CAMPEP_0174372540 /NCGR_PEP_ID=MMETSP0811_2-20130205/104007_1 /TAXON_ID=73025 ORGANISM="Eutreptiella gymnastica-like, Strain CCMP1594" /NCGR_SAMPLE_ID=MMETSP0811_2 /ASSEMBLY_ACC=CAM_ASM_000667 /LENGTH=87 /DNA_ID=CAMNT_0015520069 /DNA_START=262 /DNA_END=526 /DNA_ORIENTATION=+
MDSHTHPMGLTAPGQEPLLLPSPFIPARPHQLTQGLRMAIVIPVNVHHKAARSEAQRESVPQPNETASENAIRIHATSRVHVGGGSY